MATLAVTVSTLAACLALVDRPIEPETAARFLWLYWMLFGIRVAGQLVVRRWHPRWLPPTEQWNLVPYHLLLPAQLFVFGCMGWIYISFVADLRPLVMPRPSLGWVVLAFAGLYATSMAVRYAVRMARRPGQRWFGGTIPIVFHWVLAAYLTVFGAYHASY